MLNRNKNINNPARATLAYSEGLKNFLGTLKTPADAGAKAYGKKGVGCIPMTQEEKWLARYEEVVAFIETNHRNPSKHRIEEHDMLNWLKVNRKRMNADGLKPERVEKFKELLALTEVYRRKNQYE